MCPELRQLLADLTLPLYAGAAGDMYRKIDDGSLVITHNAGINLAIGTHNAFDKG